MAQEENSFLYHQGIAHFNRGEYFDSHEVWEELWIDTEGEDRRFYQGLIQAAVALYHLENGNVVGSRKLLKSSAGYLAAYGPTHHGLEIGVFLRGVRECFDENVDARTAAPGDLAKRPAIVLLPQ